MLRCVKLWVTFRFWSDCFEYLQVFLLQTNTVVHVLVRWNIIWFHSANTAHFAWKCQRIWQLGISERHSISSHVRVVSSCRHTKHPQAVE